MARGLHQWESEKELPTMFKSIALATALISTLSAGAAFAAPPRPIMTAQAFAPRQRPRWEQLGELHVGRHSRALVLAVATGPMRQLSLIVTEGQLALRAVKITFANGASFVAQAQGKMALIDLPGEARNIRSIEVVPARFGRQGRATIAISGERAPQRRPYFR